jgi:hypothetical protein
LDGHKALYGRKALNGRKAWNSRKALDGCKGWKMLDGPDILGLVFALDG